MKPATVEVNAICLQRIGGYKPVIKNRRTGECTPHKYKIHKHNYYLHVVNNKPGDVAYESTSKRPKLEFKPQTIE